MAKTITEQDIEIGQREAFERVKIHADRLATETDGYISIIFQMIAILAEASNPPK